MLHQGTVSSVAVLVAESEDPDGAAQMQAAAQLLAIVIEVAAIVVSSSITLCLYRPSKPPLVKGYSESFRSTKPPSTTFASAATSSFR